MTVEDAAAGMYRVINSNMAHGVREITVKRGVDPREFPMVIAGGAGGLHACMIAEDLGITTHHRPARSLRFSAPLGCCSRTCSTTEVRSLVGHLWRTSPESLCSRRWTASSTSGADTSPGENVPPERGEHQVFLDLRYLKQYHEVTIPVSAAAIRRQRREGDRDAFHAHTVGSMATSSRPRDTALELINVRVRTTGQGRQTRPASHREGNGDATRAHARKGERSAFLPAQDVDSPRSRSTTGTRSRVRRRDRRALP